MSETEKNLPDDLREGIEDVRLANHAIRGMYSPSGRRQHQSREPGGWADTIYQIRH